MTNYDFWDSLWQTHRDEYLKWCRDNNVQADLSDFSIWAEENNLIGDDEIYE